MTGWIAAAALYWLGFVLVGWALSSFQRGGDPRRAHPILGLAWPLFAVVAMFAWMIGSRMERGRRREPPGPSTFRD